MTSALRVVHEENYLARREVLERGRRIDALSVDRSRFEKMPTYLCSPDMDAREGRFAQVRAETTVSEKMAAWRALFQQAGSR